MRGLLSWLSLTSSSSFPDSDDSVLVRTPRWRATLEGMKLSDVCGVYGCGSAERMTDQLDIVGNAESDADV